MSPLTSAPFTGNQAGTEHINSASVRVVISTHDQRALAQLNGELEEARRERNRALASRSTQYELLASELQKLHVKLVRSNAAKQDLRKRLARIEESRSWRWTVSFRRMEKRINSISDTFLHRPAYDLFCVLKKIWMRMGQPFPGGVRFIRHRIFRFWRARETAQPMDLPPEDMPAPAASTPPVPPVRIQTRGGSGMTVAICLSEGDTAVTLIRSLIAQSLPPLEVIILCRTSGHALNREIHRLQPLVRLVLGEWESPDHAFKHAASITPHPHMLLLATPDPLHADTLRKGAASLQNTMPMHADTSVRFVFRDAILHPTNEQHAQASTLSASMQHAAD